MRLCQGNTESCVWPEYLISAWLCDSCELRMLFKYKEVPSTSEPFEYLNFVYSHACPPTHTCHGFIWKGRQSNNTKSIVGIVTVTALLLSTFTSTNPQRVDGYEGGIYWLTTGTRRCARRHPPTTPSRWMVQETPPGQKSSDGSYLRPFVWCSLGTPVDHIATGGSILLESSFPGREWVSWTDRYCCIIQKGATKNMP